MEWVQELVPSFNEWWPNIFASLVWSPFAAGFIYLLHYFTRKHTAKKQARIEQLLVNLHEHHGIPVPEAKE
jgi:phosphate/sulfate permease